MHDSKEALFILQTLREKGYVAYYAGGWVRDYLLGCPSDDIDIATSAPPEVIQNLFDRTVPIGLAFGIILVCIGEKNFEVATFRHDLEYKDGRRPSKIEFTTAEQDARRRDFTINGMFFDPLHKKVIDFVEGQKDLKKKIIRAIGDPKKRFKEDRLRMIRAVRLSCRFHFSIETKTKQAIYEQAHELFPCVAMERIYQEWEKMKAFHFREGMLLLYEFGLLATIFPKLKQSSRKEIEAYTLPFPEFPKEAPVIAYLLELFPSFSLEEKLSFCRSLKLSKQEQTFVRFLEQANYLFAQDATSISSYEWAHFYAHPESRICLAIQAAKLSPSEKKAFISWHQKKEHYLQKAIHRIQTHSPIVSASFLKKEGIAPSKTMGFLLKEAEKISINENLQNPEEIVQRLKKKNLWPSPS